MSASPNTPMTYYEHNSFKYLLDFEDFLTAVEEPSSPNTCTSSSSLAFIHDASIEPEHHDYSSSPNHTDLDTFFDIHIHGPDAIDPTAFHATTINPNDLYLTKPPKATTNLPEGDGIPFNLFSIEPSSGEAVDWSSWESILANEEMLAGIKGPAVPSSSDFGTDRNEGRLVHADLIRDEERLAWDSVMFYPSPLPHCGDVVSDREEKVAAVTANARGNTPPVTQEENTAIDFSAWLNIPADVEMSDLSEPKFIKYTPTEQEAAEALLFLSSSTPNTKHNVPSLKEIESSVYSFIAASLSFNHNIAISTLKPAEIAGVIERAVKTNNVELEKIGVKGRVGIWFDRMGNGFCVGWL